MVRHLEEQLRTTRNAQGSVENILLQWSLDDNQQVRQAAANGNVGELLGLVAYDRPTNNEETEYTQQGENTICKRRRRSLTDDEECLTALVGERLSGLWELPAK